MSCENCDAMFEQTGKLCISCENKKRFAELPPEQKALVKTYETLLNDGNPNSIQALSQMIELGIDDITIPK